MRQQEFVQYITQQAQQFASLGKAAQAWGVSKAYVSAIINHTRTPGPKMLEALGWEVVVDYRKKRS